MFLHTIINSASVSLVNATADSELPQTSSTNGYVPAVDKNSNNRDIMIPVQLQNSERSQTDQNIYNIIIPIITALGAIGGGIGGAFVTQRLAERIENKRIEAREKEKQLEREAREKEKQLEREQIIKTARVELTEYDDILKDVLARAKELPIDEDSYRGKIFLAKNEFEALSLPTTSYLEYPFEKRKSALTVEQAAKVEKLYRNGLRVPYEGGWPIKDFGFQYELNPQVLRIRLDEIKKALVELEKNNDYNSASPNNKS